MSKVENDALEDLLRHASPRPVPAAKDVAVAKAAVRDEWRDLTGQRSRRRRFLNYAVAATVLVAAFAGFNLFRAPVATTVQVASIEKSFGSVYLLGEQSELRETLGLSAVLSGQTILTGDGAGLALAWGTGGSLRVDEGTRIRFTDSGTVFLEEGRVYFDSTPMLLSDISAGDASTFIVETKFGEVRHVGTQYTTEVDGDKLIVSVREGQVRVDGRYRDHGVSAGQQATFAGQQQPSVLSVSRSGEMWNWLQRTTPVADVDGKTMHEFLVWVCREMGLDLEFEGQAEAIAREAILKGKIDTLPADAMRYRLATADLHSRIDGGTVYISDD